MGRAGAAWHYRPMTEWILLLYPVLLLAYLMLAARWQPKLESSRAGEQHRGYSRGRRGV